MLTKEVECYAEAAGMSATEAAEWLAGAQAERERMERLNNNEYLEEQWKGR